MDTPHDSILLEHDFLRRLARGLTRDDSAADDLAQETWLQAIRRPPKDAASPRGWLATAARNLARNQGRSDDRRRAREAQVAIASDATIDERAEQVVALQADVVAALGRLSEPLRTALVLRYYEDRSPAAIADELEIPVETARTRLKRGLAKLREDLDRRHGGDRAAWSLPLAGFARVGERTAVASAGTGAVAGGWATVAVALAVTAAASIAIVQLRSAPSPTGPEAAHDGEVASVTTPDPSSGVGSPESIADAALQSSSGAASERAPVMADGSEDVAVVRGRVVDGDGAPVAAARVELRAFPAIEDPTGAFEAVERRFTLEARTAEDGRFEIRVPLDGDHSVFLRASRPRHVAASWRPMSLSIGDEVDLGDGSLVPGGAVRVRLVDGDDRPLIGAGWTVQAKSSAAVPGRPRPGYVTTADVDEATGVALVDGVPAGPIGLSISNPLFEDAIEARADVVLGEEIAVDVAHAGPSIDSRLGVDLRGRLIAMKVAPESVRLVADGEVRPLSTAWGMAPLLFTDLEPGTYRVECDDPHFQRWSGTLETGRVHGIQLKGAASIRLDVVDAATGNAIQPVALQLTLKDVSFRPATIVALARGDDAPAGGLVDDLVPGSYEYELETEEYGLTRGRIDDLAAGPARRVLVELGREEPGITGRVLAGPEGVPVAGVDVHITAGERAGHLMGRSGSVMDDRGVVPAVDATTKTDADGRFRFKGVAPGLHTIRVQRSRWFSVDRTLTFDGEGGDEVIFQTSPGATVRGLVRVPDGFDPTGIAFEARSDDHGFDASLGSIGMLRVRLDEGGRFEIGPLPKGAWTLRFGLAGEDVTFPGSDVTLPGSWSFFHGEPLTVHDGRDRDVTVDLRERIPSELRIELGGGDLRPDDVRPWAWDLATDELLSIRKFPGPFGGGAVEVDVLESDAVPPGRYRIVLVSKDGDWAYVHSQEILVGVDEPQTVAMEVSLERRTLELRDADTDAPLGEVDVAWSVGLPESRSLARRKKPWRTDAKGQMSLGFPSSVVEITVEGYASQSLSWPTPEGSTEVVRLKPE